MTNEALKELLAECKEIASLYKALCEMYRDEVIMLREARMMSYSHSDSPPTEVHVFDEPETLFCMKDLEDMTLKELIPEKFNESCRMSTGLKAELREHLRNLMEVLER